MLQTLINLARPFMVSMFQPQNAPNLAQLNSALRSLLSFILSLIVTSALLVTISVFLIHRSLNQLDAGIYSFSPSMILLSILWLITASIFAYLILKKTDTSAAVTPPQTSSPLEQAVSVWILDMVEERQQQRQARATQPATEEGDSKPR